jgi:hypothetical protein
MFELQKIGTGNFLKDLQRVARQVSKDFPKATELKGNSKLILERIAVLLRDAKHATSWDEAQTVAFIREFSWVYMTMVALSRIMELDNSGGGSSSSCVPDCSISYDQCLEKTHCEPSWWGCICCIPCEVVYIGCISKCAFGASGGSVIF